MSLNIKNREVEELANRVALATGETKTEAIRRALAERCERLGVPTLIGSRQRFAAAIREIHGDRRFRPVTKEEWDSIYQ